jgi:serine/threonine protein kinase/tetratricopeptide (TPR) repeat protein
MSAAETCPVCGGEIPTQVVGGLCPRCLLRQGLEIQPGSEAFTDLLGPAPPPGSSPTREGGPWEDDPSPLGPVGTAVSSVVGSFPRVLLREVRSDPLRPEFRPASPEVIAGQAERGKYQILGEIARGGMGAVLRGRDADLGRDLAVKVLLEEHRCDPGLVHRFIEEAQINGQLQHPGIVPVYDLGCFADRRPFFTMKLVRGQTLSALLDARTSADEDRPRFLAVFDAVCQTMAYAHTRGVVHRDLKPSNVMVGHFGEVQVMDWGLAKVLHVGGDADEPRQAGPGSEDGRIRTARSGSDLHASRAGSVLGTPAYMPPEQARGQVRDVNERADVFALGAILCDILTGAPPYAAETHYEARRMASAGELSPAFDRLDSSGANSELVELAKRCLAPAAVDRPRDAGEVSRDMTTYLTGVQERLRAAEIGRAEAHARTVEERKRRSLQGRMAAAIMVSLLAGIVGVATQWTRAESNLKTSEARLKLASEAIERFYTGVSEDVLLKEPRLKELREKLLGSALEFYKKLQASLEAEPGGAAGVDLAAAYERVGEVTEQIGSQVAALEALDHGRALRQRIADAHPNDEFHAESLAAVLEKESRTLSELGRTIEALQSLRQARSIRQRLADEHPQRLAHRTNLARTDSELGDLLGFRMNRKGEAREALERAISLYEALRDQYPAGLDILRGLGEALAIQGRIANEMGKTAEALGLVERAASLYEEVVTRSPDDLSSREKLGRILMNQGYYASNLNQMKDAGHPLRRAVEIFGQLSEAQPNASLYHFHLARARQSLAWWLHRTNHQAEALIEFRTALEAFDRLAQDHPGVTEYASNQSMCLTNLSDVLRETGRLDESLEFLRRARVVTDRLVSEHPNVDHYLSKRADLQIVLASLLGQMGRRAEAETAYEQALAEHEALVHKDGIGYYNIACAHACLASLIGGQPHRMTELRRAEAARHLDAAMSALRQAADAGYRIVRAYARDPDLAPLRTRSDFRDFLSDLAFPNRVFAE